MPPRDLFNFEFFEDGGGGAPMGEAPEIQAEEPAWGGPSQEEWAQTQQALGYITEYVQSQQAPPESEQGVSIDPFAEDYGTQLGGYIQNAVQQAIAPIMEYQQGQQLSEAEERAIDILEDIVTREGDLSEKETAFEMARALANVFLPEESQKHGFGPAAAEAALARSVKMLRARDEAISKSAIEQHMNQLTNLSGAGREPGVQGAGSQEVVTTPGGDELSLVRKYGGFPGVGASG